MIARKMRVLLWSVALLAAPLAQPADLDAVISALRAQDFHRALTLTKELNAQNKVDPRVWTLEGMANEGLKNRAEALVNYRTALKIKPDYVPALKAEAQLEYSSGNPNAKQVLDRILKLEPGDEVSHAMLAALAYRQGDCSSAVRQYRQSGRAIADKPDALTQFGECLLKEGQPDESAVVLGQVVSLEPNQWWTRYNFALAEMRRKRTAEAIKILEPVLDDARVEPEALDLAAEAYETSGDTPRAVDLERKAILSQPKNETYYLHFADLSFDHQSFAVGIDMIDVGLTQLSKSSKLYLARGILRVQLGDFVKAEIDFDRADQLDGNNGAISGAAASLAELQNSNLEKALQLSREKLKSNSKDPMLHYVKAETLKQMGVAPGTAEFREALDSASTAVRLKPRFIAAQNLLGSLYVQENRLQMAREQFQAVLKEDPSNQTAIYHLIQVSRKAGKSEEIPGLIRQMAQARLIQRHKDESVGQYRLVEAQEPSAPPR